MTQPDDALTTSREVRARHADRTDALDKVGALKLLPDDVHATKEIVAAYFDVPVPTIESVVENNRVELESNGYRVLRGADLRRFAAPLSGAANPVGPKTRSLALFNRRAILNVAMVLRDSVVARTVRTYLLDAEQQTRQIDYAALDIKDPHAMIAMAQAVQYHASRAIEQERRAERAERLVDELAPAAATLEAIEAGDGMPPKVFRKHYFPDIPEREFFEHLYRRKLLIDQRGGGTWDKKRQRYRDGWQHGHPGAAGNDYFYLHTELDRNDIRRYNARVRPGKAEIALRDLLIRQGLVAKLPGTDIELRNSA